MHGIMWERGEGKGRDVRADEGMECVPELRAGNER